MVELDLLKDGEEISFETLSNSIFAKMGAVNPQDAEGEDQKVFASGAQIGYLLLGKVAEESEQVRALLTLSPEMANWLVALFTAGMFSQRAITNPENKLEIILREVPEEENDTPDAQSADSESAE
tara:strand:+ start:49 stop:423 length:375 start_codon:yes stop_codon:yes gene_type:complete